MITFTPEQKRQTAAFAASLIRSDGISSRMQTSLIELAKAVFKARMESTPIDSVELVSIARRSPVKIETNWERLILEEIPRVFNGRDSINIGPVNVRTQITKDGAFYVFSPDITALSEIAEFEDQLLRLEHGCAT